MTRLVRPFAALALAAAALPATSAAQHGGHADQRMAQLLSDRAAPRSNCRIENRPSPLPSVNALVDSAALDAKLRDYVAAEHLQGSSDMHVLFSLGFDGHGAPTRVRAFDWYLPQGTADVLTAAVHSTVHQQRGEANVRLRIDFVAGVPTFRVGHSEICAPLGLERVNILAPATEQVEQPHDVRVRVIVSAEGHLIGSNLLTGSGQRYWDDEVMKMIDGVQYAPGIVDEAAEQMSYDATIHFRTH
jgi:TonB family protein